MKELETNISVLKSHHSRRVQVATEETGTVAVVGMRGATDGAHGEVWV